jgi:hypothetical protein
VGCVGERINLFWMLSVMCYGVSVFLGFTEKSNGCSVVWWVLDHVCVTC